MTRPLFERLQDYVVAIYFWTIGLHENTVSKLLGLKTGNDKIRPVTVCTMISKRIRADPDLFDLRHDRYAFFLIGKYLRNIMYWPGAYDDRVERITYIEADFERLTSIGSEEQELIEVSEAQDRRWPATTREEAIAELKRGYNDNDPPFTNRGPTL